MPILMLAARMARRLAAARSCWPRCTKFAPSVDGLAPIIVDHELAVMHRAEPHGPFDLSLHHAARLVLDAQLHQSDATREQAGEPIGVGNDGIEGIEADQGGIRPGRSGRVIDLEEGRAGDRGRRRCHVAGLERAGLEGKPSRFDGASEGLRHLHRIARLGHGGVEQDRRRSPVPLPRPHARACRFRRR